LNICVCGYYGFGNFGDELFIKTLAQIFEEDRIFPLTRYMDVSQADAVIIGGGDLITPYFYNNYYFPESVSKLPTWVYGVGIVDYYPEETWPVEEVTKYRAKLQSTQGLYLRDSWSADTARSQQFHSLIKVVPDIAFAYREPGYPVQLSQSKRPVIGVCVFAYPEFPLDRMVSLLSALAHRQYHIALIPVVLNTLNPYSDRMTCLKLKEGIKAAQPQAEVSVAEPTHDIEMTYSYIQSVDYLISFKLHPALVALRNAVPVLCFSKMGKVRSMLESFHLQQYMLDYEAPLPQMMQKVEQLLAEGRKDVEAIQPLIELKEKLCMVELESLRSEIRSVVSG
jgi:polysaccharide pyruvyl transferase WcaK-like protein